MRARLGMLESLYRFDVDEATHIQLISEAAAQHWRTRGAIVLLTARTTASSRPELAPLGVARDGGREYRPIIADLLQDMSEDEFRACLAALPAYGGMRESEASGVLKISRSDRMAQRWRIRDMLGCYCSTHEGGLVGLMNSLDDAVATSHRERAYWQPVAAHLAAAWRLRQRLALGVTTTDLADAVLLPDGRCVAEPHTALDGPLGPACATWFATASTSAARAPRPTACGRSWRTAAGRSSITTRPPAGGSCSPCATRRWARACAG